MSLFPRTASAADLSLKKRRVSARGHEEDDPLAILKDNLFAQPKDKKRQKPKTLKKHVEEEQQEEKQQDGIENLIGAGVRKAKIVKYSDVQVGDGVFGVIVGLTKVDLVVKFGKLKGFVSIREVSDKFAKFVDQYLENESAEISESQKLAELSEMFSIGDFVACTVVHIQNKKSNYRIELSMRTSLINRNLSSSIVLKKGMRVSGEILSIEDHGYVIDLGVDNLRGFIKKSDIEENPALNANHLLEGRPLSDLIVKWTKPDIKTVGLGFGEAKLLDAVSVLEISSIVPGMLVQASVSEKYSSKGNFNYEVLLFDGIRAYLHYTDLDLFESEDLEIGSKITARIVYINYEEKFIALSQKSALVSFTSRNDSLEIGSVVESSIRRLIPNHGALVQIDDTLSFIGLQDFAEGKEKSAAAFLSKEEGSLISAKVMKYDYFDNCFILSAREGDVSGSKRMFRDFKVGAKVDAVISKHLPTCVIVTFSGSTVQAFCHVSHLSEISTSSKSIFSKFPIGMKLKVRILSIESSADGNRNRIAVTNKKTMVTSDLPVVASATDVKVGCVTHGYISKISDSEGIYVQFYNNVYGIIPRLDLRLNGFSSDLSLLFQPGQVVKVRVASNEKGARLILSMNLSHSEETRSETIHVGELVSGVVLDYTETSACIKISKNNSIGILQKEHLTDFEHHVESKYKQFMKSNPVGSKVEGLLIVSIPSDEDSPFHLSMKPALKRSIDLSKVKLTVADYTDAEVVAGWVTKVLEYGICIALVNFVRGFIPNVVLSKQNISSASFVLGQTIFAKVEKVDLERNKLRLVYSAAFLEGSRNDKDLSRSLFLSKNFWEEFEELRDHMKRNYPKFGDMLDGKVEECVDDGVIIKLSRFGSNSAFTPKISGTVSFGSKVSCRILDRGIDSDSFVVSLVPFSQLEFPKSPVKKDELAHVELITRDYIVLTLRNGEIVFSAWPYLSGPEKLFSQNEYIRVKPAEINSRFGRKYVLIDLSQFYKKPEKSIVYSDGLDFSIGDHVSGSISGSSAQTADFIPVQIGQTIANLPTLGMSLQDLHSLKLIEEGELELSEEILLQRIQSLDGVRVDAFVQELRSQATNGRFILALRSDNSEQTLLLGKVCKKAPTKLWYNVLLGLNSVTGLLHITDCSDQYTENEFSNFNKEFYGIFKIIGEEDSKKFVSHRSSLIYNSSFVADPSIDSFDNKKLHKNSIIRGFIAKILEYGVLISLGRSVSAVVLNHQLESSSNLKNALQKLEIGQLVKGVVLSVNGTKINMSLREDIVKRSQDISAYPKDTIVSATVKSVNSDLGLFLVIEGTNICGLCHASQVSDEPLSNLSEHFKSGDLVRAIVLKSNVEKARISFSMKDSLLSNAESQFNETSTLDQQESSQLMVNDSENLSTENAALLDDFSWNEDAPEQSNMDVDDEPISGGPVEQSQKNPISKKRKLSEIDIREEEKMLSELERSLADQTRMPETSQDYERMLVTDSNNSSLWIRYMAYYIHLKEIDEARKVAERALSTISFREESHKLDIWIALLNLENLYGNQAAMNAIVERALKVNDPKKVYLQTAKIYENTEKYELADACYSTLIRKFSQSAKVWLSYGELKYNIGQLDAARQLLKKAIRVLPAHKHVKVTVKFGLLEFKHGNADRARTIFEGILDNFPKRSDIWNVYIDQELKVGDEVAIRNLFERTISLQLPIKKMKQFFKRYLEYEQMNGDESKIEYVKQKAREFVESHMQS
jgi:rRNA biogenesis protein RRP5